MRLKAYGAFTVGAIVEEGAHLTAVVDRDGHHRTLSAGWESLQGLAWSPSGELWFTGSEAGAARSLYAVTLEGRQRVVARVPGGLVFADLASDGRALAMHEISTRRQYVKGAGADVGRDLSWFDWSDPTALSSDGKLTQLRKTPSTAR